MKNWPENEYWDELGRRLNNFAEEPDDDWDKIAAAIPPVNTTARWIMPGAGVITVAALALFLLLPFPYMYNESQRILASRSSEKSITLDENNSLVKDRRVDDKEVPANTSIKSQEKVAITRQIENDNKQNAFVTKKNDGRSFISKENSAAPLSSLTISTSEFLESSVSSNPEISAEPEKQNFSEISGVKLISGDTLKQEVTKNTDSVEVKKVEERDKPKHQKEKKKFKPTVYFMVTPSLAFHKVTPLAEDQITIQKLNSPSIISSERLGVSFDAGFQIPVKKYFTIYSGVSYYQQSQTMSYTYQSPDVVRLKEPTSGFSYTLVPGTITRKFDYSMRNIGVSAGMLYQLMGDKLKHKMGGGLQYQKGFLSQKESESYNNRKSTYLNYQLVYRVEFAFRKNLHLFAQPSFVHSINAKESLSEPLSIKPYRAGVGLGVVYQFK